MQEQKKVIMITGASRGIGAAAAEEFARQYGGRGVLHLLCRQSLPVLLKLKEDLEKTYGVEVHAYRCDVGSYGEVEKLCGEIGRVDILVNNAAVSYLGLLTDMAVEDWDRVIGTNLSSIFYVCKCVLPGMISRKEGRIVNISSVWGNVGASMEVAYSAAKGGVNSFTRALAKELGPCSIPVNAVAFGMIDTEMNASFTEEEKAALREEIPADRLGTVREAAELIVKVAEAPTYLTGQVITMDGGWI